MTRRYGHDDLTVVFEEAEGFICITFRNELTPLITHEAYYWLNEIVDEFGEDAVRFCMFDYRQVESFHEDNLAQTRLEIRAFDQRYNLDHVPVAMLVKNLFQEQMAQVLARLLGSEARVRIVRSASAGFAFYREWRERQAYHG